MNKEPTIASLLATSTRKLSSCPGHTLSNNSRLDAELLLCHCLEKDRSYLYTWPEKTVSKQALEQFNTLVERRCTGEPFAYLTGEKEFWSKTFNVSPATLIPRPETEILLEQSLGKLADTAGPFLDLGTGSGIVAICTALKRRDIEVHATDISSAALEVARSNAARHTVEIMFSESHWFDNLAVQQYAVIASNPPYIAESDPHLQRNGLPFEPATALRSCDNGFADITAIIEQASDYLATGGWLLLEHGHLQGSQTRRLMLEREFTQIETVKDYSGNDRVTLGKNP